MAPDISHAQVKRIYKPVIIVFGGLVVALFVSLLYTGWSSTVITITPLLKPVSASLAVTIAPTTSSTDDHQLAGTVTVTEKSATVTTTPKGDGIPVPAHATGTMTIINNSTKVQPLAVGTRLKSDSGIIVRTDERVDAPAGGKVTVSTTADPLGETGNLPAGKFVIVALWPGLQDKIYGQTSEAMTGGLATTKGSLSVDDLTSASEQAENQVKAEVGTSTSGKFIVVAPAAVVSKPKPEVPSVSYQITVTLKVTTVTYSSERLNQVLHDELSKSLVAGQELTSTESPTLTLTDRPTKDTATFSIQAKGQAGLTSSSPLLSASTYVSMSGAAISKKLVDSGAIQSSNVKIAPWWRSTAPDQANRITIIKNAPKP